MKRAIAEAAKQEKRVDKLQWALGKIKAASKSAIAGAQTKASVMQLQLEQVRKQNHQMENKSIEQSMEMLQLEEDNRELKGNVVFLEHEIDVLQDLVRYQRDAFTGRLN